MTVSSNGTPTLKSTIFASTTATVTPTAWPNTTAPAANSLILAVVTVYGTTTGSLGATPGGWTLVNSVTGTARAVTAYYTKTATGSDSFPTFNGAETGTAIDAVITCVLYDLSDSGGSTPVVWTDGAQAGTSGTLTACCGGMPAGSFVIAATVAAGASATTTWTVPGTYTLDVDQTATGFAQTYCAHQTTAPTAGAASTHLFTHGRTSTYQSGMVIGIAPPGSTGIRQFSCGPSATAATNTATTVSFTPMANATLVILAGIGNGSAVTATSVSVTSSAGTPTLLKASTMGGYGLAVAYALDAGASPSAQTATVTAAPSTVLDPLIQVIQFDGAGTTAQQATQAALNAVVSSGATINSIAITPAKTGSQVVGATGSDTNTLLAANTSSNLIAASLGGGGDSRALFQGNVWTTATTAQTVGASANIAESSIVAVEIIPAVLGGVPPRTGPVRAVMFKQSRARAHGGFHHGVFGGTGTGVPLTALDGPARAKLPAPRRGHGGGSSGTVVAAVVLTGTGTAAGAGSATASSATAAPAAAAGAGSVTAVTTQAVTSAAAGAGTATAAAAQSATGTAAGAGTVTAAAVTQAVTATAAGAGAVTANAAQAANPAPLYPLHGPVRGRQRAPARGRTALATPPPVPGMRAGIMPGYLYPTYPEWARFLASPGLLPAVVILNCGNGDIPWNTDYQALCTSLHALGITVLGYTYTINGTRAAATVEAAVGNYLGGGITPGGNGVDGIFLDEFQATAGGLAYYQGICASIQAQFAAGGGSSSPLIWGNPGTWLDSSYLTLPVATFITFENHIVTYPPPTTPFNVSVSGVPQTGAGLYPRSRFAHLIYGASRGDVDGFTDLAYANYAGWAFAGPGTGDNPYSVIPANDYLTDLVTRVRSEPVPAALQQGIPPPVYPQAGPAASRRHLPPRGRVAGITRAGPPVVPGTGTAAITGAGSVTAVSAQAAVAAAAGAGTATAAGTQQAPAAAAGAGTAAAVSAQAATSAAAGAGTAAGVAVQAATATAAGAGSVTAAGVPYTVGAAAGAGAVTAAAAQAAKGTAAGTGTAAAAAAQTATGTAAGAGSVTDVATQIVTGTAAGAAAATDVVTQAVTAAAAGSGTASAAAVQPVTATAAGAGSATAVATQAATATAAGAGAVTAAGSVSGQSTAAVSGAGSATAAAVQVVTGTAAGAGTAAAAAVQAAPGASAGAGTAAAAATQAVPASPSGAGSAVAAGTQAVIASAAGAGSVTAAGSVIGPSTASASGAGTASGIAVQAVTAAAAGAGSATAAGASIAIGTASISGAGTASAVSVQAAGASAAGAGSVTARAVQVVIALAAGSGAVTAVSYIVPVGITGTVTWAAHPARPRWQAIPEPAAWQVHAAPPRWRITMTVFTPIAATSLEYVNITWTAELAGTVIDPTGQTPGSSLLVVEFAFPLSSGSLLAPAEPSNWYAGSWLDGTTSTGYIAQCLAGPDGTVLLAAGMTYDVWSQVQGVPEAPRKFAGQLSVY